MLLFFTLTACGEGSSGSGNAGAGSGGQATLPGGGVGGSAGSNPGVGGSVAGGGGSTASDGTGTPNAGAPGSAGVPANGGSGGASGGTAGKSGTAGGAGTSAGGNAGAGVGGSAGVGGGAAGAGGSPATGRVGYYVDGRHLYDRCGERVVLRGVNEMVVWSGGKDGVPEFAEIARTNANAVRIVWTIVDGNAAELDTAITNALAQRLIPMIELHDATGNFSGLNALVNHWTTPGMLAVIREHQANLLLNIGNEVGNNTVSNTTFENGYRDAITRLRTAGVRTPLVIDAATWGQNIDQLQAVGPRLIAHDPDHNVLLSVHMWWSDANGQRVRTEIAQSVSANLPLIVGEFAHHALTGCSSSPFDYRTFLAEAQAQSIGWLAWSWGSVGNSDCADDAPFDMTTNGTYATLTGWGREVAVSDPNSIQNTSVRPYSMLNGRCR